MNEDHVCVKRKLTTLLFLFWSNTPRSKFPGHCSSVISPIENTARSFPKQDANLPSTRRLTNETSAQMTVRAQGKIEKLCSQNYATLDQNIGGPGRNFGNL